MRLRPPSPGLRHAFAAAGRGGDPLSIAHATPHGQERTTRRRCCLLAKDLAAPERSPAPLFRTAAAAPGLHRPKSRPRRIGPPTGRRRSVGPHPHGREHPTGVIPCRRIRSSVGALQWSFRACVWRCWLPGKAPFNKILPDAERFGWVVRPDVHLDDLPTKRGASASVLPTRRPCVVGKVSGFTRIQPARMRLPAVAWDLLSHTPGHLTLVDRTRPSPGKPARRGHARRSPSSMSTWRRAGRPEALLRSDAATRPESRMWLKKPLREASRPARCRSDWRLAAGREAGPPVSDPAPKQTSGERTARPVRPVESDRA